MIKILLIGGTKDSINIINYLKGNSFNKKENSFFILTTTTTEYGGKIAKEAGSDEVISKALNYDELIAIVEESSFNLIIDATHPFATNISQTLIKVALMTAIPYIRFERPSFNMDSLKNINKDNLYTVDSFEKAGELIKNKFNNKNVFSLAGINTAEILLNYIDLEKFFIRILPVKSSIDKANQLRISSDHIIAIQGIFSKEFNKQLMNHFNTEVIVTKDSGAIGGVPSKIEAANELNISTILVKRPKLDICNENIVNDLDGLKKALNNYFDI
ncbi:MAG: precorrin-6A reductase [Methanobrevibacter sp.]|jgi:precorrin-6A/cobalt-precorrin-6A reductase|nr:precorrin-6A reductase [Methanobrevibacter sp.]